MRTLKFESLESKRGSALIAIAAFASIAILPIHALGSACCGGSFAMPSLILGDDKAQVTTSVSHAVTRAEVSSSGKWTEPSVSRATDTMKFEAAHVFADRFQAGGSLSVLRKTSGGDQRASGLGDTTASLGYEFLTDWDYDLWVPKGVGFLQLTLPTGRSAYEELDPTDARGRGLWALGAGAAFVKVRVPFDLSFVAEAHHAFERDVESPQVEGTLRLKPGWGHSVSLNGGYSKKIWRVGAGIEWREDSGIDVEGAIDSSGAASRYVTASLSGNVMIGDHWAMTLAMSDQSLFGSPQNTSLGRSVSLSLQRRWFR